MRSLQCSLLLSRFRIWGFLEPLELTIYIIWLQMRYFTYFPFPYDLDIYIFLIHCSLFHLHSTHIFQLQIICCSFLSLILLLLYTWQFVSPTRYSHIYSEKLVHLPHCYFVNDYKQVSSWAQASEILILNFCNCSPSQILMGFMPLSRKTVTRQIQAVNPGAQIMGCQRTNSFLLVLISSTRWILRYLRHGSVRMTFILVYILLVNTICIILFEFDIAGAIFLSVYQTVLFGFSDFQLQER